MWGQKEYPVPYATKKLLAYILIAVVLYGVYGLLEMLHLDVWLQRGLALALLGAFALLVLNLERKEFQRLPYVGKFFLSNTV
jgi:hypothetical protein